MYNKQKIVYLNKPIDTINDLKELLASEVNIPCPETYKVCDMFRFETVLNQQLLANYGPYSFKSMLEAQDCLAALDFLETIKYSPNIVDPKKLLTEYLYSKYNFSHFVSVVIRDKFSKINILLPGAKIITDKNNFSFPTEFFPENHVESTSTYLTSYLTNAYKASYGVYNQTGLKRLASNTSFSLPLYECLEFLLLFTFYDGRNFEFRTSEKIPRRNPKNQFSHLSYKLALYKLSLLYTYVQKGNPYAISTLFRCDSIFFYQKLNILHSYYDKYQCEDTANKVMYLFRLSGNDIERIKKTIISTIFEDKDFIMAGLRSKYLDFMLPFDIFFQFMINARPLISLYNPTVNAIKNKLEELKKNTLTILQTNLPSHIFSNLLRFETDESFSIENNEYNILQILEKNTFYKYYTRPATVNNNTISFDIIKSSMQIDFADFMEHDF